MIKIPYGKQTIEDDDVAALVDAIKSPYLTTGPAVDIFEQKLAEYTGAKYAVAVANGTVALHLAYAVLDIPIGGEFITSPLTFVATANAGLYCGLKPVFADIDADTGNISVGSIESKITKQTKLIVPVHYGGLSADMEEIKAIAGDIPVVEDACHALGGVYKNAQIGSCKYSKMAVFSFHPVKAITTGEGGAITTNDSALYERMKLLRTHGITTKVGEPWIKDMSVLGYNYRLTDFQAALGNNQLKKIDRFIKRRLEIAVFYDNFFQKNSTIAIPVNKKTDGVHARHLYPVIIKNDQRDRFMKYMQDAGIGVQVHYGVVHHHSYYKENFDVHCPISENFASNVVSLPIYPDLTEEMLNYICKKIIDFK